MRLGVFKVFSMYEKYASYITLQNTSTRVPGFVGLGALALHGYTVQDYVSVSGCIPSVPNAYTNVQLLTLVAHHILLGNHH
jgi:hypothetical protein